MYLDTVEPKPPPQIGGIGYQVFSLERDFEVWGEVRHMLVDPNSSEIYKGDLAYGKDYRAIASKAFICNLEQKWPGRNGLIKAHYNPGFHLWMHKEDAEQHLYWMKIIQIRKPHILVLRKVQYTNTSAEGYIDGCGIVVAITIRILVPEKTTNAFDHWGNMEAQLLQ